MQVWHAFDHIIIWLPVQEIGPAIHSPDHGKWREVP